MERVVVRRLGFRLSFPTLITFVECYLDISSASRQVRQLVHVRLPLCKSSHTPAIFLITLLRTRTRVRVVLCRSQLVVLSHKDQLYGFCFGRGHVFDGSFCSAES
jgi:hypothetical protein